MVTSATTQPRDPHPWLDQFQKDSLNQLDRLLNGRGRIAPYDGADAPDIARLLFGGSSPHDVYRTLLDETLLTWLNARRIEGLPSLNSLQQAAWVRAIASAFEIVGLLKLTRCATQFNREFLLWNSWAQRLAISPQRDGHYTFLRTLALTQKLVNTDGRDGAFAFEPFWLRLCSQAGENLPAHYLEIGLLGLRFLPERSEAPSEGPWINGLARWALHQQPPISDFSKQWWALKAQYPRMPAYWRATLSQTLGQKIFDEFPPDIKDWWLRDVGVKPGVAQASSQMSVNKVPSLSPPHVREALMERVRRPEPLLAIQKAVETLVKERQRYAEVTGDSYYLVTTACSFGMQVIEGEDDPVGRGRLAASLARKTLEWEPTNPHGWALWRDALTRQGAFEAAELIGWETIRRFPENVQWRNQLAELLIALDHKDEAMAIVEETFARELQNAATYALQARLLFHSDNLKKAKEVLEKGITHFAQDDAIRTGLENQLQHLQLGELPLKSTAFKSLIADADTLGGKRGTDGNVNVSAVGMLARLRRRLLQYRSGNVYEDWRAEALADVRQALANDPNSTYAKYLSFELESQVGESPREDVDVRPFALAFIAALQRKDLGLFAQLEKTSGYEKRAVDVAKAALFGDLAAGERALKWLDTKSNDEARPISALRRLLTLRIDLSAVHSGAAFVSAVAANDNIELDLVESVLATEEFLLAA